MAFILLTTFLQGLIDYDTQLFLSLNSLHTLLWDNFMVLYSGKLTWAVFYASLIYVLFKNYHWKQVVYTLIAVGIVFALTDAFTSQVLRPIFCRLRPSNLENPISSMVHIVNNHRGGRYGFPSCHSANCWGLAFFLIFLFRNRMLTCLLSLWAITICYSRIYLGVHYPGDLLAGMLIGFFWGFLGFRILSRLTNNPEGITREQKIPVYMYLASAAAFMLVAVFDTYL